MINQTFAVNTVRTMVCALGAVLLASLPACATDVPEGGEVNESVGKTSSAMMMEEAAADVDSGHDGYCSGGEIVVGCKQTCYMMRCYCWCWVPKESSLAE
jgi:hypothetical protein